MVLHLSQVSSCSVLINLRNNVLNFAVFTTVFEFKIGFSGVNKHSLLPWQQLSYDLNNGHFRTSPVDIYLHANLSGGSKFFISHFVWFLQRIALKTFKGPGIEKSTIRADLANRVYIVHISNHSYSFCSHWQKRWQV